MHYPKQFTESDIEANLRVIKANPLASLVAVIDGVPEVIHVPFHMSSDKEGNVIFQGHVARVNPFWKACAIDQQVLLIFNGPDAYVSPNFYPSKAENPKVVPTWNYSSVHVRGKIQFIEDPSWLYDLLDKLSMEHEQNQPNPWTINDAPKEYVQSMVGAIVGIEIHINEIIGKSKLSQNRPTADFLGVIDNLSESNNVKDQLVAKAMEELAS